MIYEDDVLDRKRDYYVVNILRNKRLNEHANDGKTRIQEETDSLSQELTSSRQLEDFLFSNEADILVITFEPILSSSNPTQVMSTVTRPSFVSQDSL